MMIDTDPVVVINIVSVSYSGSTWANLVLGSQSQALSIGEIDRINTTGRALCSLHGPRCALWSRFDPHNGENIYLQIARLTGKWYLVVNNTRDCLDDQRHPSIRSKFILLVRDG